MAGIGNHASIPPHPPLSPAGLFSFAAKPLPDTRAAALTGILPGGALEDFARYILDRRMATENEPIWNSKPAGLKVYQNNFQENLCSEQHNTQGKAQLLQNR
ncbi:MAG: DNA-binding domain-containing protein [Desulfobacterales bacterium]|nr:DNA-binding domain-containing protein [Desulfobacterales bacterium]